MKATGIVRRIDDLGRVVIPKEIRRTLRLREGTPLEIFTDREGEIILKKYSPMVELAAFATQYADAMAQTTGLLVAITDRDQVIAVAGGSKKEMLQKPVSRQLEQAVTERSVIVAGRDEKAYIPVIQEEMEGITAQVVVPDHLRGRRHRRGGYPEPGAAGEIRRYGAQAGADGGGISWKTDGKLAKRLTLQGNRVTMGFNRIDVRIEVRDSSVPGNHGWAAVFRKRGNRRRISGPPMAVSWDDAEYAAYCHVCGALSRGK